jgi:hypothetical protein
MASQVSIPIVHAKASLEIVAGTYYELESRLKALNDVEQNLAKVRVELLEEKAEAEAKAEEARKKAASS